MKSAVSPHKLLFFFSKSVPIPDKSGSLSDEDPSIVPCIVLLSLSQLTHQVHVDLDVDLGLDLVMATVGLGKHKKSKISSQIKGNDI